MYDIALIPKAQTNGRFIGIDTTKSNSGFITAVYRFLKLFLTPIGTDPSDLTYGTEFGRMVLGNVDPLLLEAVIVQSVNYALDKLREYDRERDDDSAIDSVVLRKIQIDNSGTAATIYLDISNRAGKTMLTYITTGAENA